MARDSGSLSLEGLGIQPPYSMQAEQSVLGAALLDSGSADRIMQRLRPEMFFVAQNRAVFQEMLTLVANSQPIDVVILIDRLATNDAFESADTVKIYLNQLAETVPSLSNLSHYIGLVYEKYVKRLLMSHATEILEQAGDDVDSQIMLEGAEQKLYEIRAGHDTSDVQVLKDAIIDMMRHLQNLSGPDREKYLGIPTGFTAIDQKLTGLGRSDLVILASRPGMGKTSFALNIAMNVAERGLPVVIFSLEMTKDQLTGRILSSRAGIDNRHFRVGIEKGSDWVDLAQVTELVAPFPLYLDDTSAITIPEMKSKIRDINRRAIANDKPPVGLVVIDYLQLMSSGQRSENRVQEISAITRNLKIMAKDLDVPLLVLSQLSRSAEKSRADNRPFLSDLRDSGSIEQDADVVMFLYRDSYYDDSPEVDQNTAECIIAKNRHGDTGTVDLFWDGAFTRFSDLEIHRSDDEAPPF